MMHALNNKHKYSMFIFLMPIFLLLGIASYNVSRSFSFGFSQVVFFIASFLSIVISIFFLCNTLENNFIAKTEVGLFSILAVLVSSYLMLDTQTISKLFLNFLSAETVFNYLTIYLALIAHIINSIFTVLVCVSLIVYIPQALLSVIVEFSTFKKISFAFVRQVAIVFIVTFLFKSILLMLLK